jgi:hypothetical protein
MSALGQKQTFRAAITMSALPPKADMCGATCNVGYGPSGHGDLRKVPECLSRR